MRGWFSRFLALAIMVAVVAGCGGGQQKPPASDTKPAAAPAGGTDSKPADKEFKVAFVEFSTGSGSAWVRANLDGVKFLEQKLPGVTVTVVENIPEGPGVATVMRQLAQAGNKVIFADGFGYAEFVPQIAKEFPDVKIIVQEAWPADGPNIGSYYGYLGDARYLQGIIAGTVTKSNIIGFVAAHPYPLVISGLNAFALGVQTVNPKAVIKVVWVNNWYDPPKEKEGADSLLNAGADVIANQADSDATLKAAAAKNKFGMTSNADWSASAPQAILTGNSWNWGNYYVAAVKQVQDGTWKPGRYMGTLKDGVVGLAPFGPGVTPEAKAAVEKAIQEINAGTLKVFKGPLLDNQGKERVPAGQLMTFEDADLKMDWLIKGVEGNVK